jgi:hypothetical protein
MENSKEIRIIKFRVWDATAKPPQMYIDPYFSFPDHLTLSEAMKEIEKELGWVRMQFTGLTDKKGKDIYHGDIIDTPQRGIEVVEIDQEYDMIGYHECWERSGIILGNIHEHPELLEQQP